MTTAITKVGTSPLVGRCGAILALLSLLFLPIAGCEDIGRNGMEVLADNEISEKIKFFVALCIGCAALGVVAKPSLLCFLTGGGGILALLIGYAVARQDIPIKLMVGGYLAIIGFIALLVEGGKQSTHSGVESTLAVDRPKAPPEE